MRVATTTLPKLKKFGDSFEEGTEFEEEFVEVIDHQGLEVDEQPIVNMVDAVAVNAVAIKLPPFWSAEPKSWFNRVDSIFRLKGINQELTKFDHVVAILPSEFHWAAMDEIDDPDEEKPYTVLKAALLGRFQQHPVKEVLDMLERSEVPGEMSPSQLEDGIKGLSKDHDILLKAIFVRGINRAVRGQVLDKFKAGSTIREARETAESLLEELPQAQGNVSAVQGYRGPGQRSGANQRFGQNRGQGSLGGSSRNKQFVPWCRHHKKFGPKAYGCVKPCGFIRRSNTSALTYEPEESSGNEEAYH